jgi:hypothetical protein
VVLGGVALGEVVTAELDADDGRLNAHRASSATTVTREAAVTRRRSYLFMTARKG